MQDPSPPHHHPQNLPTRYSEKQIVRRFVVFVPTENQSQRGPPPSAFRLLPVAASTRDLEDPPHSKVLDPLRIDQVETHSYKQMILCPPASNKGPTRSARSDGCVTMKLSVLLLRCQLHPARLDWLTQFSIQLSSFLSGEQRRCAALDEV